MANKDGAQQSALEKFFAGKGFYIVLFLCAAVIGVSAWTLLSREGAVDETMDDYRPAVTAPAPTKQAWDDDDGDAQDVIAQPPETVSETPMVQPTPEPTVAPTPTPKPADAAPTSWLWPVYGAIARQHSVDTLVYDDTMGDWRTHDGLDILAPLGEPVKAAAGGTVTEVYDDGLYGTTVVIDHGAGIVSVYSNLAALPTVVAGDSVSMGDTIGSVGTTAICETNSPYHLHFAMRVNGESVDPTAYLPVR